MTLNLTALDVLVIANYGIWFEVELDGQWMTMLVGPTVFGRPRNFKPRHGICPLLRNF